ncbi:MAG: signal peptidase I [Ruminococcaceae bacterium]|nr:signal peptidase I [Oscillospiraceae bacterium]
MKFLKYIKRQNNEPEFQYGFSVDTSNVYDFKEEAPRKQSIMEWVLDGLDTVAIAIIAVIIIFTFIFRMATISGDSMKNTLFEGDRVIITNFAYKPQQNDIVVVSRNAENSVDEISSSKGPIIKRVIAVGGQTVDIDFEKGEVYVDGEKLVEDYISSSTVNSYDVEFPVFVPEGHIFVLGDNRAVSLDSRSSSIGDNGVIDERYVLGKAVYRIFPFNRIGRLDENE